MKTLHIISSLAVGGAERALFNLLAAGLGKDGEVAVLSLTDEGVFAEKIRDLGVTVYSLNLKSAMPSLSALVRLRKFVRDFQPDLIQGWMYHGNLFAMLSEKWFARQVGLVWNIRHSLYSLNHEKFLTRQVIRLNRLLSSQPDCIIYNSHLSRMQHEKFGFAASKGQVIPNGFDVNTLLPCPETRRLARQTLGIGADKTIIGHVARFHPVKNHAGFLRAAVEVINIKKDVVFLLMGRDVHFDNPALQGIVPLDLQDKFYCLGERQDVDALMQAMDIFCLSSSSEAFPNVLAEAMSLSLPCVTTDVGDSREIVAENGVVVPPNDAEALANGILAILDKTAQQRIEIGKKGRRSTELRYGIQQIVGCYEAVYSNICSKS